MSIIKSGKYGVYNVVAHPHPQGVYRRVFERIAEDPRGVRFYGDRFATISPLSETRGGVFSGRLAIWTEIDPKSNMIDKQSLKEQLLSESPIEIPSDVGFNSRVFSFAFRERDHRLFVELLTDEGKTLSAGMALKAFSKLLGAFAIEGVYELDIFQVSRSDAIDVILSLESIRRLEIVLNVPNPDDLSEEKQKLLDEIGEMKAKRLKIEATRSSGEDTIVVNDRYRAMAELAADNGHVSTHGAGPDGQRVKLSSKDMPEIREVEIPKEDSRALYTRTIAETAAE